MSRSLLTFALLLSVVAVRAQDGSALHGRIEGRTYISPTGTFKVAIPVLPELGGEITDTPNVVTFQDAFNTHVSIAVFPQDATQRWEMATRGTKDYLAYFFANYVLADFKRSFPGADAESAVYVPKLMNGSLLAYLLIPGGSMFMDRVPQLSATDKVPVAKRGNMVFVKNGDIFVISTELAERVIEGKLWNKTPAQEDQILRRRLEAIVDTMTFMKTPSDTDDLSVPTPSSTTTPAPSSGK